jgi:hypothetical protein
VDGISVYSCACKNGFEEIQSTLSRNSLEASTVLANNVNWKDETLANNNQRLRDQDSGQQRSIIAALANNVNDCVLVSLGLDWGKEDSFNQSSFEN